MHSSYLNYLDELSFLYANQYDFRLGHSTDLALASLLESILSALEARQATVA